MSLSRAFTIIEFFAKRSPEGVRVTEISQELKLHCVTVHRLLNALIELGYVEQSPDRRYNLGIEAWSLGQAAARRFDLTSWQKQR